ncbi:MAG: GNAT family N-acetyltransferase [Dehalococcoidia bacterium]
MSFEPASLAQITKRWDGHWGGFVVTPERIYRPGDVEAVALIADGREVAFVSWAAEPGGAEIVTLDAEVEGQGYGRAALDCVEGRIREAGGTYARLFTTNDNVRAIGIYLRRGYRLARLHLDSMDRVRQLKPGVPLEANGLPLRDMWEFRKDL